MWKKGTKTAKRLTVDEIATVAAAGVARALDARQAAGVELTAAELADVHGGSYPVIRAGGIPSDYLLGLQNQLGTLGSVNTTLG
jgi:hypothetical protein